MTDKIIQVLPYRNILKIYRVNNMNMAKADKPESNLHIAETIALKCYQCGKCTAGCPVAGYMDLPPSMILRLIQTGDNNIRDRLYSSKAIWLCVGCETCLSRCPQEVDIPSVMDCLRQESIKNRKNHPDSADILSFHKSFLDSIHYTGRLYEAGLIAGYKLRTRHMLQDLLLAPKLVLKGKLGFLPHMVKDRKNIKQIFSGSIRNKTKENHK